MGLIFIVLILIGLFCMAGEILDLVSSLSSIKEVLQLVGIVVFAIVYYKIIIS